MGTPCLRRFLPLHQSDADLQPVAESAAQLAAGAGGGDRQARPDPHGDAGADHDGAERDQRHLEPGAGLAHLLVRRHHVTSKQAARRRSSFRLEVVAELVGDPAGIDADIGELREPQ